jgi:hypothetical protein
MRNRVEHLADLTVAAFVNHDRQHRLLASCGFEDLVQTDTRRGGPPPVNHHAAPEALETVPIRNAANLNVILALDLVARMREMRGEITVTRQQQQSLGVEVEAPDRVDVFANAAFFQEVYYGGAVLRVRTAGDVAARLVHQDIDSSAGRLDAPAIDADVVVLRVSLRTQLGDCLAVHRHAALPDQLFGCAA